MATVNEAITTKIIELVQRDGLLPWRKPWRSGAPRNGLSGRPYRGINRLVLGLSDHADPRWLTFKQALDLGGHVRKGEKGTQVVLWRWVEDEGGVERPVSRTFTVFNCLQCEGLQLREEAAGDVDPIEAAEAIVAGYPNPPRLEFGGDRACYVPATDTIQMPERERFVSAASHYSTLFHEEIHSSGAAHRLARPGVVDPILYASESYAQEELVAEIGSSFLLAEAGIEGQLEQSSAYVANWLQALRGDKNLIVRAAGQAQRAVDHILGTVVEKAASEES